MTHQYLENVIQAGRQNCSLKHFLNNKSQSQNETHSEQTCLAHEKFKFKLEKHKLRQVWLPKCFWLHYCAKLFYSYPYRLLHWSWAHFSAHFDLSLCGELSLKQLRTSLYDITHYHNTFFLQKSLFSNCHLQLLSACESFKKFMCLVLLYFILLQFLNIPLLNIIINYYINIFRVIEASSFNVLCCSW